MATDKDKDLERDVDPKVQPDRTFRRASTDEERSERVHQETTESNRFSDEADSVRERGYPPEGVPGAKR